MNRLSLAVTALLALTILSACGGNAPQTTPEPATATQTVSQPTETPITEPPTIEATATEPLPTAAPATEVPATEAPASGLVSYATQIKPIFDNKCIKCHGVESRKEGLDMLTYESLMAGSFNGTVIIPGDANNSLVIQLTAEGEMPKRGPKVTPEELQIIINWVDQGAVNN